MALATMSDSNVNFIPFWCNKIEGFIQKLKASETLVGTRGRSRRAFFKQPKAGIPLNPLGVYFAFRGELSSRSRADLNSHAATRPSQMARPNSLLQSARHLLQSSQSRSHIHATARKYLLIARNFSMRERTGTAAFKNQFLLRRPKGCRSIAISFCPC